ncbi:MAG: MFS transporter [Thermotogae bacterium]|nr:MFS transporter [Thermotogota bacterium]
MNSENHLKTWGVKSEESFYSLFYLFFFLSMSFNWIYRTVFLKELGVGEAKVGFLMIVANLMFFVAQMFWGFMADNFGRKRILILQLFFMFTTLILLGLSKTWISAYFFLITMILLSGNAPSVLDSLTLSHLGDRRSEYGKIRFMGSIGWAVGSALSAWVLMKLKLGFVFILSAFLLIIPIILSFNLKTGGRSAGKVKNTLRPVFTNRSFIFMLIVNSLVILGLQSYWIFGPMYMKNVTGLTWIVGIATAFSAVFEMLGMRTEHIFSRKFGRLNSIAVGYLAIVMKLLVLSFLKDPLSIVLLHSIEFFAWGIYYPASIITIGSIIEEEYLSTAQSIFATSFTVIGGTLAGLIGGILIEKIGMFWMFRVMALLSFTGFLMFLIFRGKIWCGSLTIRDHTVDHPGK